MCLHQNLAERTRELEASKIVSSRNRSDINRHRLVLMQRRNRLFDRRHQQTTSMDYHGWHQEKHIELYKKEKIRVQVILS